MYENTVVSCAICPNCQSEVTEIDAVTGMCEPCYLESQFHECGDCTLILSPRGRIFYLYATSDDTCMCFSLFSEIGAYWQPKFRKLLDRAHVDRKTKETETDYFDAWSQWSMESERGQASLLLLVAIAMVIVGGIAYAVTVAPVFKALFSGLPF